MIKGSLYHDDDLNVLLNNIIVKRSPFYYYLGYISLIPSLILFGFESGVLRKLISMTNYLPMRLH